ncbi:MAG: hypothetical protein Q4C96_11250 [Planctomycetia bacterium]|nr:hypothetical protein [Planctomycetia bacterium]
MKKSRIIYFCIILALICLVLTAFSFNRNRIMHYYGADFPFLAKIFGELPCEDTCCSAASDSHAGHNHAPGESCSAASDSHAGHNHASGESCSAASDSHAGHNHAPGESCSADAVKAKSASSHNHAAEMEFSVQALRNIGITKETLQKVKIGDLPLTMNFPAIITERPGRSTTNVTAPVSGIILRIYRQPGEMLFPGEPFLDMDLSNESVVAQQMELLALCQKRDIVIRELERLSEVAEGLVVKAIRETEFEKLQLDSDIQALVKTLTLSGFSEEDVRQKIIEGRTLIRHVTIPVPMVDDDRMCSFNTLLVRDESSAASESLSEKESRNQNALFSHVTRTEHDAKCSAENQEHLQLVQLFVEKGQRVNMGDSLGKISDMTRLFICGSAWDYDEKILMDSLAKNAPVTAIFQSHDVGQQSFYGQENVMSDLRLKYVDNLINTDTRTLKFYVEFENQLLNCACEDGVCHQKTLSQTVSGTVKNGKGVQAESAVNKNDGNVHFSVMDRALHWRYRPGQRCEVRIQYDRIPNCILLPKEAVASSGIEHYVFQMVHEHENAYALVPVSVNIIRQTRDVVAVANDGTLSKNAIIALRGASQLVVAMNAARGGAVPESACGHDHSKDE